MKRMLRGIIFVGLASLAACSGLRVGSILPGPTALPGAAGSPLPSAPVEFVAVVPAGEAPAAVILEIVDTVTGADYNATQFRMESGADRRFSVQLSLPLGSLIRYRYRAGEAGQLPEVTSSGEPLRYRVAHIESPMQTSDQIAAWAGSSYEGPSGRIIGQIVERGTGQPVTEMVVTASGKRTFSDAEGKFRLEGMLPGLATIVAYHPSGAYQVFQQGAMIAAEATTPASIEVEPAVPVTLTFQVTVPETTALSPRIAGNVLPLGDRFSPGLGGLEVFGADAPQLVPVDSAHYLFLTQLYAGTDLRYKYTLGDGLWNAERSASGEFVTRRLIVPETDFTMEDTVASWGPGPASTSIELQVPGSTPSQDEIAIQFNPFTWFEPLPMTSSGGDIWSFELLGPVSFPQPISYRYCRNSICAASEAAGPARVLDPSSANSISDTVGAWQWLDDSGSGIEVVAPDIAARPTMELGVELAPTFLPQIARDHELSAVRARELGANAITLTPSWSLTGPSDVPRLEFDPTQSPFESEMLALARSARANDMAVFLRPELDPGAMGFQGWWDSARRDANWWAIFYDELRSFLVSQAATAQRIQADKLILTGVQLEPTVPGGRLPTGVGSGAPFDSIERWDEILRALRAEYTGKLAYEIVMSDQVEAVPPFLDRFDEIHVYWHAPLTAAQTATIQELEAEAARMLDLILLPSLSPGLPVTLSVEYASAPGTLNACPVGPDGGCLPIERLDLGQPGLEALSPDLLAQAQAYNALLLAVYDRPIIRGVQARRFLPLALQDPSASVFGKPAADVLWYWYPRLLGEITAP